MSEEVSYTLSEIHNGNNEITISKPIRNSNVVVVWCYVLCIESCFKGFFKPFDTFQGFPTELITKARLVVSSGFWKSVKNSSRILHGPLPVILLRVHAISWPPYHEFNLFVDSNYMCLLFTFLLINYSTWYNDMMQLPWQIN